MIKSMTGFGRAESVGKCGGFTVEIRTVNHRYFDVSSRIPNSLNELEDRIKKYIHRYIKRGKVNFSLLYKKPGEGFDSIKLDEEAIVKYYSMLNKIRRRFKLKDDIKLSHILSFPDVIVREEPQYDPTSIWSVLEQGVKNALLECNKMREKEGKALFTDLTCRMKKIARSIDKISRFSPRIISEYKKVLDARIRGILKAHTYDIDKARLETEVAIFAKQCDISEELTRAKSHLRTLKDTLSSTKEAGRRLDFILQEVQREINTLGSKAGSQYISRVVIDIKSEIEKMREQVQNVE